MTSASELFYTRRSRFGRNSDPFEVGSHSPVDRGSRCPTNTALTRAVIESSSTAAIRRAVFLIIPGSPISITLPIRLRQRNQTSQIDHCSETVIDDVLRLIDAVDGETDLSRDWLATMSSVTDSIGRLTSNKPPGLAQEALDSLCIEVFGVLEKGDKEDTTREIMECSICLESFLEDMS